MGDLLDLDAVAAEATGEVFTFNLAGEQFTLPSLQELDRRQFKKLLAAFSSEDIEGGLAPLLGDQWQRFEGLPLTVRQLNKLLEAYMAQQGVSPGESAASTGS